MKKLILSILLIIGITSLSANENRQNSASNKRNEIKRVRERRERRNRKDINLNKENTVKKENIVKKENTVKKENVIDKKNLNLNKEIELNKEDEKKLNSNKKNINTPRITGPRYRLEVSISTLPVYNNRTKQVGYYAYKSFSILPEWKKQVTKDIDITFGPKFSANLIFAKDYPSAGNDVVVDKGQIIGSLSVGTEVDFNFRLKENIKLYIGVETTLGLGIKINTLNGKYISKVKGDRGQDVWHAYVDKDIYKSLKYIYRANVSFGLKINDKYNVAFFGGYGKGHFGVEFGHTF
ncbi:hypothetical protein [Streptobacillus moniliformis]|uniref:hypothetical protein n=1 Tax=Streptobacillus moniliformis TaxID=34105 RepID=UPI0007E317C6|nr:hypothetical protein [Streptobacillus moniliformis]